MSKTPSRAVVPASPLFVSDGEDPIFTAIERHRAAMAAFSDAVDTLAVLPPGPELDAVNAITARKSDELDNAGVDLVTVQPTTFAGLIALLSHIVECSRSEKGEDWRLPGMLLFDSQTGKLRRAEFLEPKSEEFAYFAMLAVANTVRRLAATGQGSKGLYSSLLSRP
jgi:2-methylisocitrate lyase-like PEP mutase family enzyme